MVIGLKAVLPTAPPVSTLTVARLVLPMLLPTLTAFSGNEPTMLTMEVPAELRPPTAFLACWSIHQRLDCLGASALGVSGRRLLSALSLAKPTTMFLLMAASLTLKSLAFTFRLDEKM